MLDVQVSCEFLQMAQQRRGTLTGLAGCNGCFTSLFAVLVMQPLWVSSPPGTHALLTVSQSGGTSAIDPKLMGSAICIARKHVSEVLKAQPPCISVPGHVCQQEGHVQPTLSLLTVQ
jgi:hypothetical protein